METIDKIQKLYYDTFHPNGISLEFGTEIKAETFSEPEIYISLGQLNMLFDPKTSLTLDYARLENDNRAAILGKPISITMLLRLLEETDFLNCQLSVDGLLSYHYIKDNKSAIELIGFNLSKGDLLRNQDEEVINKIGELLNIKW